MMIVDRIIDNIKSIECPVDMINNRLADACKVPGIGGNPAVAVERLEDKDGEDTIAYSVHINNTNTPDIVAMVRNGQDGYVSTVIDAYTL
jgi:hypothetical protein